MALDSVAILAPADKVRTRPELDPLLERVVPVRPCCGNHLPVEHVHKEASDGLVPVTVAIHASQKLPSIGSMHQDKDLIRLAGNELPEFLFDPVQKFGRRQIRAKPVSPGIHSVRGQV